MLTLNTQNIERIVELLNVVPSTSYNIDSKSLTMYGKQVTTRSLGLYHGCKDYKHACGNLGQLMHVAGMIDLEDVAHAYILTQYHLILIGMFMVDSVVQNNRYDICNRLGKEVDDSSYYLTHPNMSNVQTRLSNIVQHKSCAIYPSNNALVFSHHPITETETIANTLSILIKDIGA